MDKQIQIINTLIKCLRGDFIGDYLSAGVNDTCFLNTATAAVLGHLSGTESAWVWWRFFWQLKECT